MAINQLKAPMEFGAIIQEPPNLHYALTTSVSSFSMEDAQHLIAVLQHTYQISLEWSGCNYCGLQLKWDYKKGFVDISIPGYVTKALAKYNHTHPQRPKFAPMKWTKPIYGRAVQYAKVESTLPVLDEKGTRRVQSKIGTFLYYGRAVDPTILVTLNEIGPSQSKQTK